ncbi:MAG TPA: hypothetical protein VEI25_02980 [Paraburkholderia sp.]|nr:hypothetical protein [Paraburkholderia sp.]
MLPPSRYEDAADNGRRAKEACMNERQDAPEVEVSGLHGTGIDKGTRKAATRDVRQGKKPQHILIAVRIVL